MGTGTRDLWNYCATLNLVDPNLLPKSKIYADLRWSTTVFTKKSVGDNLGCTQGSGPLHDSVCHVVEEISTYNEYIVFINMELCESPPGQLSLRCLHDIYGSCGSKARERQANVLVHWLLTMHKCVRCMEIDDCVIPNFSTYLPLYCDALKRSLSIMDLKVVAWKSNLEESRSLLDAIICMPFLETFQCEALDLSAQGFREYLKTSVTLKELAVAYAMEEADIPSAILNALRVNSHLSHLSVHSDILDADSENWFGDYVARTATLQYIKLQNASPGAPRSLVPVFQAISKNRTIKKFDIVFFNLGIDEALSFADLTNVNRHLRMVNFITCAWSSEEHPAQYFWPTTCSTPDMGCAEHISPCTAALARALGPQSFLEEITVDLSSFNACEQKTLLCAFAQNTSIKKMNVEGSDIDSASSLCKAMRETGTTDRVHLGLVIVTAAQLTRLEGHCVEAPEISLVITAAQGARQGCLKLLTLCPHLTVLNLNLSRIVYKEEACLLSIYLRRSHSIRELYMSFSTSRCALLDILQSLSTNTTLEKLGVGKCVLDVENATFLASMIGKSETICHFEYQTECVVSCRLLLTHLARCLSSNTSLVSLEISEYRALMRYSAAVMDFVRHNAALLDCAAHFVLGTRNKHCAEAFEPVAIGRGIVSRVQELAGEPCAERVIEMIRDSRRSLLDMRSFMEITGVIKNDLSWDESVEPRERLEILPFDCWLHVRQFIKVRDMLHWVPSTGTRCKKVRRRAQFSALKS
ncbi:uncharacterized protein [Dermacentor albipictus]|uniref:uncharacterized protein n=1 Tax=Dermacentor albipictus TaxID=60249 RepID=UPI0031FD83F7